MTEITLPSIKLTLDENKEISSWEFIGDEYTGRVYVDIEKSRIGVPVRGKSGKRVGNMDRYKLTIEKDILVRTT